MRLDEYVEQVQAQLAAAAALGDESTRTTAQALAAAAGPAVRLVLLAALSAAADDITPALLDLPGAPVLSVRLDGDEVRLELRVSEAPQPAGAGGARDAGMPAGDDAENAARISLRLPESLKARVEGAARADAVSVNTWILRVIDAALTRRGHRVTGWING